MRIRFLSILTVAAAIAVSLPAHAAPPPMYDIFILHDPAGGIDWILPDLPTPTQVDGNGFEMWSVPEEDTGDSTLSGFGKFIFDDLGDLQAADFTNGGSDTFTADGDGPMFTGGDGTPNFTPGTYHLLDSLGHAATLTIAVAPEPSSIMLLGTGILIMAAVMRRRLIV